MTESHLTLVTKQNESLERSLRSLREKLSGLQTAPSIPDTSRISHDVGKKNVRVPERRGVPNGSRKAANTGMGKNETDKPTEWACQGSDERVLIKPYAKKSDKTDKHVSFQKCSRIDGNFFDEFRNNVNEIRKQKTDKTLKGPHISYNEPRKTPNLDTWRPGGARLLLVSKIELQNEYIEGLEAKIHELKEQNQQLSAAQYEMREKLQTCERERRNQEDNYRQMLLELETKSNPHRLAYPHSQVNHSESNFGSLNDTNLRRILDETKRENAELRFRVTEIGEHAYLLNHIQEKRVEMLQSKVAASISVARYYCNLVVPDWQQSFEDSTEQILYGLPDNTTTDLLKDGSGSSSFGIHKRKKCFRAYILAVLFAVRLKRQIDSQRLWEPQLQSPYVLS